MKIARIRNFRKGFATNSSSTHSIIYKNKEDIFKDLNIFELDYYDRYAETLAVSKEAKIKYIAANIFRNTGLYEIMSEFYPSMKKYEPLIEKERKELDGSFGMCYRNTLFFPSEKYLEASIKYIRDIIDNDELIIVGGSDEEDFYYDKTENHKFYPRPTDGVFRNGNYYYALDYGTKIRYSFSEKELIPSYPELIDLKITNKCEHNCPFCYQNSNKDGEHANINFLRRIIYELSSNSYDYYERSIEFAIGGGNVLLYPDLDKLLKYIKDEGNIANVTIRAKDCETILKNENLKELFTKYVTAIGISISDAKEAKYVLDLVNENTWFITLHIIPEYLGVSKTLEVINSVRKKYYCDVLFLGYKTTGRGGSQKYQHLSNGDLNSLFENQSCINVDTTFANTYYDWLKDNYDTELTLTRREGEFSMYIDGVSQNAYKSSYDLSKPYHLGYKGEFGKDWIYPLEAFKRIREDNGLETFLDNLDNVGLPLIYLCQVRFLNYH